MPVSVQLQGGRTLRRTLKEAGVGLEDLKDAHAAVARTVVDSARPWVPVGATGALVASLRGSRQQAAAVVSVGGKGGVRYAGPIHWGWPKRHIKARPFIWIAAHKSEDQWVAVYLAALEKIIDGIEGAPGP